MKNFWNSLGFTGRIGLVITVAFLVSFTITSIKSSIENTPHVTILHPTMPVLSACDLAMSDAALEMRNGAGETKLKLTGDLCASKVDWMKSLTTYPEAIGLMSAEYLDGTEIRTFCSSFPETKICK